MHELGIMINIIEQVEKIARENEVEQIEALVLQVGEIAPVVPQYLEACFPAAVDGTLMQDTELRIEVIPANALCKSCRQVFHLLEHPRACPECESTEWEVLSGREFNIKEIIAC
jgi:hydrogenase nickel incorporation protein HypA/HybF